MERYNLLVTGRVQGVGFRYFVQTLAMNMNLYGWVKNLDTGQVEIDVQGPKGFIIDFEKKVKKGNHFSKVEDIEIRRLEVEENYKKFKVKY